MLRAVFGVVRLSLIRAWLRADSTDVANFGSDRHEIENSHNRRAGATGVAFCKNGADVLPPMKPGSGSSTR
jgi:hypothetical protein